jgi:hypothetical protein
LLYWRHRREPWDFGNADVNRPSHFIAVALAAILPALGGCAAESVEQKLRKNPIVAECDYGGGKDGAGTLTQPYCAEIAGTFHLYRATSWTALGVPKTSERMASRQVTPGDQVAFDWLDRRSHWWGDLGSDLLARVGEETIPLGKAAVRTRYYWCYGENWDEYWKRFPGRVWGGIGSMFLGPRAM